MKHQGYFAFAVLSSVTCLLGTGCALESVDEGSAGSELVGTYEGAVESENRLSMNRLSMNRLSMNGLSQAALSMNGSSLVESDLAADAPGRELLSYMVKCALKSYQSLSVTHDGVTYTFKGQIGLAHDWINNPLTDPKKQRWVSACLLAHVNGYGIQVPISLRGSHPALYASEAEKDEFKVQETAFFGNVFVADPNADNTFYSCGGYGIGFLCGGTADALRPQRSCADAASCGLLFPGMCKNPMTKQGNSCRVSSYSGYLECHEGVSDAQGHFPAGDSFYNEVITVYLRPQEWNQLYTSCTAVPVGGCDDDDD
jgi:hypothetical protein